MSDVSADKMRVQLQRLRWMMRPEGLIWEDMNEMRCTMEMLVTYMEDLMDKKMHGITKRMKTAEKDIRGRKLADAQKTLAAAEKANEKLVKVDRNVRDPLIDKARRAMKKHPKDFE